MSVKITRFSKNIKRLIDFIRSQGGDVHIRHFRAPNVANAKVEGRTQHVIKGLTLSAKSTALKASDLEDAVQAYARETTFDSERIEVMPDLVSRLDEKAYAGLGIFAREAKGFTVALVTDGAGNTFPGRSICSNKDEWNTNIGTTLALKQALELAYQQGSPLGVAWKNYVQKSRVERKVHQEA